MVEGDETFDWDALSTLAIHPLKVAIIEAIRWTEAPLSVADLTKITEDYNSRLQGVSYHLGKLVELGALEVVGKRDSSGSLERSYFFQ